MCFCLREDVHARNNVGRECGYDVEGANLLEIINLYWEVSNLQGWRDCSGCAYDSVSCINFSEGRPCDIF